MDPYRRRSLSRAFAATLVLLALLLILTPAGSTLRTKLTTPPPTSSSHPQKSSQRSPNTSTERTPPDDSPFQTRQWSVPADLTSHLADADPPAQDPIADELFGDDLFSDDPFADAGTTWTSPHRAQESLMDKGVLFPGGTWAHIDIYTGILKAHNTPEQLALIDQILSDLGPLPIWVVDRELFDNRETPTASQIADLENISVINAKLKNIIIPEVHLDNTTFGKALEFLRKRSCELDIEEPNPSNRGVKLTIREPLRDPNAPLLNNPRLSFQAMLDGSPIKKLHLENVPIATVLQYMMDTSGIRYRVDPDGVSILSASSPEPLQTKHWHVAPELIHKSKEPPRGIDAGRFTAPDAPDHIKEEWMALAQGRPLIDVLKNFGITFPKGTSVKYTPERSELTIVNNYTNIDDLERLFAQLAYTLSKERHEQTR